MMKAALFPKLGPPPSSHTMLLQGGQFEFTEPTLYGEGGRGWGGMVKLSKKAKCTMTFDQDCNIIWVSRVIVVTVCSPFTEFHVSVLLDQ